MKIITKELYTANPETTSDYIVDLKETKAMINFFNKNRNQKIKIYDLTTSKNLKENEVVSVKDHINKSGVNPVIGNKELSLKGFKDISNIYLSKEGVITTCCGKNLNKNLKYPSHYLCIYTILLYYIGYQKIEAYLVNYD